MGEFETVMQTRDAVEGLHNFREFFENSFENSSHLNTRGMGEFETVMQTRDAVEGLHNFREFFQPPKCLDEAM